MGKQKEKNRLPEKQTKLVKNFYPKNEKQSELIDAIEDNEIVIASGPAGTGKTYVALATALSLLGPTYKKIVLIKSVTTIPGEEIGFLKGGLEQKMEPFVMSYIWNIDKICEQGSAEKLMEKKIIEILPLAYARGLSIDDSIVIIDEAQNMDAHTFKTIITRIGENSKYILLGDTEQIDRRRKSESCLAQVISLFEDTDLVGCVEFTDDDCVRNPIIPKILNILRDNGI